MKGKQYASIYITLWHYNNGCFLPDRHISNDIPLEKDTAPPLSLVAVCPIDIDHYGTANRR